MGGSERGRFVRFRAVIEAWRRAGEAQTSGFRHFKPENRPKSESLECNSA